MPGDLFILKCVSHPIRLFTVAITGMTASIWIRLKITLSVNTVGDFETFFWQCFLDILDSESIDQLPV